MVCKLGGGSWVPARHAPAWIRPWNVPLKYHTNVCSTCVSCLYENGKFTLNDWLALNITQFPMQVEGLITRLYRSYTLAQTWYLWIFIASFLIWFPCQHHKLPKNRYNKNNIHMSICAFFACMIMESLALKDEMMVSIEFM